MKADLLFGFVVNSQNVGCVAPAALEPVRGGSCVMKHSASTHTHVRHPGCDPTPGSQLDMEWIYCKNKQTRTLGQKSVTESKKEMLSHWSVRDCFASIWPLTVKGEGMSFE